MGGRSPYRTAAERPTSVEPVAPAVVTGIRAAESDVELATSACEYDTPEEPERLPRFVIVSFITGLVMIIGGLLAMFFFG